MKKPCFTVILLIVAVIIMSSCGSVPVNQIEDDGSPVEKITGGDYSLLPSEADPNEAFHSPLWMDEQAGTKPPAIPEPGPEAGSAGSPPQIAVAPEPVPPPAKPEPPKIVTPPVPPPVTPEPGPKAGSPEPPQIAIAPEPEPPPAMPEPEPKAGSPEPPPIAVAPEPEPPPAIPEPEPEPVIAAEPVPEPKPPVVPEPEPPRVTAVPPPPVAPPPSAPSVPPPPPPAPPLPAPVVPTPPLPAPVVPPPVKEEPPVIAQEPPVSAPPPAIPELPNPTPAITGPQENELVFSRTVRATVGQMVVIPFRGTGWVYLGEAGAQRGIVYDSRGLDPEGQNFMFRTEATGEYALKFYRQDFIRDFILNDYVKVIVGPPPETAGTGWFGPSVDRGRVMAEPRWPTSLAEAQALRADTRPSRIDAPAETSAVPPPAVAVQPPANPPTVPVVPPAPSVTPPPPTTAPSVTPPPTASPSAPAAPVTSPAAPPPAPVAPPPPPDIDPESHLKKAREEFGAGHVASAISLLDQLRVYYPLETDEMLWLYGQFYEANSPSRNILTSLNYYNRLMQEYPQSSRYDDAHRRVAYLQRYYINIH